MSRVNITKDFLIGGRAIFTVAVNDLTALDTDKSKDRHYTYMITQKQDAQNEGKVIYFASHLCGPNNDNPFDYNYLGVFSPTTGTVFLTAGSKYKKEDKPVHALNYALNVIYERPIKEYKKKWSVDILHCGRCSKCNLKLTTPQSLERGMGPKCVNDVRKRGVMMA